MKNISLIIFILIFSITATNAQNDKDEAYNMLLEKYGKAKSLALKFKYKKDLTTSVIECSLRIAQNNKYILEQGNNIIYCNGKTLWNYFKKENKVIISNFEANSEVQSFENLFFNLIKLYKPTGMSKESSSTGVSLYCLDLAPTDASQMNEDIKSIKLKFDIKTYLIRAVELVREQGREEVRFSKIDINPKFTAQTFDFTPPKDAKVIDLR